MAITDKNYVSHSIASLETLVMEQKPNGGVQPQNDAPRAFCRLEELLGTTYSFTLIFCLFHTLPQWMHTGLCMHSLSPQLSQTQAFS